MSEWVMLQAPEVLLCYGGGLLCFLLERAWQASRGWLTWLGGALEVIATALLILSGGTLYEASAWLCGFLLLMMEGRA